MNISRCQLHQFQRLNRLKNELVDEDAITYGHFFSNHCMMTLYSDFRIIIALAVPVWYKISFEVQVIECEGDMQEESIDLQDDKDVTMRLQWHHGKNGYGIIKVK